MEKNREFQKQFSIEAKKPDQYMTYEMEILNRSKLMTNKERQERFSELISMNLQELPEEKVVSL